MEPDLYDKSFSIITLLNLGHTCLFQKGFCTVYFSNKKYKAFTLQHIAHRKHAFLVKTKDMFKSNKLAPINKSALRLLHHRLGHRYTRSFMAEDTANAWKDNELRIDPDPFCT